MKTHRFELLRFGLIAAALVLVTAIVIPPLQFPDEPHHFAAVMIEARGEGERESIERGTIELMDRYQWWRLAGMGRPAELPKRLSEIRFLMADSRAVDFRDRIQGYLIYHTVLGWAIGKLGIESLSGNYLIARAISGIFFLFAILLVWLSMKRLSAVWNKDLKWAATLAVLVPQVAFVGIGVSPDAFVMFLSAAFFWSAIALISGAGGLGHIALALLAGGIGLLADRSSMIFGALIVLLPFFIIRRSNLEKVIAATLLGLVASILVLYALFLRFPIQLEREFLWLKAISRNVRPAVDELMGTDGFVKKFWLQFIDTSFMRLGWMHFGPPRLVQWIWRIAWVGGIGGLLIGIVDFVKRRIRGRGMPADITRRQLIQFSIVAVLLQCFALWLYYGSAHILPQGRYLFPVLIPFIALLAAGLHRLGDLFRAKLGLSALLGLTVFEIFVWAYALWAFVIPIFRLTIRSPYPGV